MVGENFIFSLFLIFAGAAVLSTFALAARQSMLVAYILLGVLLGPWGIKLVTNADMIKHIGDIGIIFLLFLLGLHLPPQKLIKMLKKVSIVGLISSIIFVAIGYGIGFAFGYSQTECFIIGAAMMFSSTIIGIKLLPTTILHHKHTGEVMISVLLLQDLIAILVLLVMHVASDSSHLGKEVTLTVVGFPTILVVAYFFERYVLLRLFKKFNRIKEYLFLVAIAWCLCLAQLSATVGLSEEIGAFIAGVSLASSPVAIYIAESLKPIRDFFLVMFFFSVGASFNLDYLSVVIIPAALLTLLLTVIKPAVYTFLLQRVGEERSVASEVGFRLGQISEFSLIIAYVGLDSGLISSTTAYLIEAATILSFIISSYYVIMRYPTPVAVSDKMRKD